MFLKTYRVYLIGLLCLMFAGQPAKEIGRAHV